MGRSSTGAWHCPLWPATREISSAECRPGCQPGSTGMHLMAVHACCAHVRDCSVPNAKFGLGHHCRERNWHTAIWSAARSRLQRCPVSRSCRTKRYSTLQSARPGHLSCLSHGCPGCAALLTTQLTLISHAWCHNMKTNRVIYLRASEHHGGSRSQCGHIQRLYSGCRWQTAVLILRMPCCGCVFEVWECQATL